MLGKDYLRIDGKIDSKRRQELVDQFNSQKKNSPGLFLISTRAGSLGINLVVRPLDAVGSCAGYTRREPMVFLFSDAGRGTGREPRGAPRLSVEPHARAAGSVSRLPLRPGERRGEGSLSFRVVNSLVVSCCSPPPRVRYKTRADSRDGEWAGEARACVPTAGCGHDGGEDLQPTDRQAEPRRACGGRASGFAPLHAAPVRVNEDEEPALIKGAGTDELSPTIVKAKSQKGGGVRAETVVELLSV